MGEITVDMSRIRRLSRAITISLLFGIPVWLLGTVFGAMFGNSRPVNRRPKIKYVIFDLGDVLLAESSKEQVKILGLGKALKIGLTIGARQFLPFMKPLNIRKKKKEIAGKIRPIENPALNARTQDGSAPLSQIDRDWLSGKYSCKECLEQATQFVENHPELFSGKTEQKSVETAFRINFTPEHVARILKPVKEGIKFVQECKDQGMEVLILSNMDSQTADLLQENYPQLFGLFKEENIFISGDMRMIKPDPQIFETVLRERDLDPHACVFFDDQKENVEAARACGISAVQCSKKKKLLGGSKPDIDYLRKQLAALIIERELEALDEERTTETVHI